MKWYPKFYWGHEAIRVREGHWLCFWGFAWGWVTIGKWAMRRRPS